MFAALAAQVVPKSNVYEVLFTDFKRLSKIFRVLSYL